MSKRHKLVTFIDSVGARTTTQEVLDKYRALYGEPTAPYRDATPEEQAAYEAEQARLEALDEGQGR